jgi:uncharacterized repeat protein (TIGR02543 family)
VKRDYGQALGTLAKATRSGYDFLGWYTGKAQGGKASATAKVSKSVTYYAHWRANGPVVTLLTPMAARWAAPRPRAR